MPNIAAVLKQEIARVARRETRSQIELLRKTAAQQRRGIAGLKRNIAALERRVAQLSGTPRRAGDADGEGAPAQPLRFSPKGIRGLRRRLGLSAADFARLMDVSAQSVYNWERRITRPRASQLKTLWELRGMGKKEAAALLGALDGKGGAAGRAAQA